MVFCTLSPFQLALYDLFIRSPAIKRLLRGVGSQPLKAIGILKKLCNHPDLLHLPEDLEGSEELFPDDYKPGDRRNVQVSLSGKMAVLERFLSGIRTTTDDKIVLISNYTQTLDIFERLCRSRRWGFFRLDGTMNINKRQRLVDRFNDPHAPEFVFLLSSKAGGCGLNLIGANRLVLFDPGMWTAVVSANADWNPASDQQALARVWRDGQKKECTLFEVITYAGFVYRFIATGSIEEKILQRQSHKQLLSSCVVDDAVDAERHFSGEDLRALFQFKRDTACDTHDTYKCKRCDHDRQLAPPRAMLYGDTSTYVMICWMLTPDGTTCPEMNLARYTMTCYVPRSYMTTCPMYSNIVAIRTTSFANIFRARFIPDLYNNHRVWAPPSCQLRFSSIRSRGLC